MTLDEAVLYVEGFCRAVVEYDPDSPILPFAPTGESYLTMTSGGTKREGDPHPALFFSTEKAIDEWVNAVLLYGGPTIASKTFYWRERPAFRDIPVGNGADDVTYRIIYSRMLISVKSPQDAT